MNKSKKWISLIVLFTLFLAVAGQASAQSQWDISLSVPYYVGLKTSEGDVGEFSQYMFLLPDVKWNYFFGPEWLHVGAGLRLWTLVIESAIYPIISLESNLGNFVINANIGGGVFLFFGLYNDVVAESVFLPEISVAYRLGKKKRFSLGTGGMFVFAPGALEMNEFAFIGTAFARWTF